MTTISIASAPTSVLRPLRAAGPRLRLTARGRRVLAAFAALPAVAALVFALLAGGAALAADDAAAGHAVSFATVTVQTGDSLWAIAERVAPSADPRDVVDAIVQLNALGGSRVIPGQTLSIPAEYAPSR